MVVAFDGESAGGLCWDGGGEVDVGTVEGGGGGKSYYGRCGGWVEGEGRLKEVCERGGDVVDGVCEVVVKSHVGYVGYAG